jgi:hypothetical protein
MEIARILETTAAALLPVAARGRADAPATEESSLHGFAPLLAALNAEGRRLLANVARSFAADDKLRAKKGG